MYVTRILGTVPYQCYMPRPLIPDVGSNLLRRFEALERRLSPLNVSDEVYMAECAKIVAQARNKYSSTNREALAGHSVARFLKGNRVGPNQLIKIHASLTSTEKPGLRSGLAWVGSQHPGNSWHVGSPPEHLNALVKGLASCNRREMPSIVWAITVMLRILQIHPFHDGNGRVARFYAIWSIYNGMGGSLMAASAIDSLFDRSRLDLQSLSLTAQTTGNFDEILDVVAGNINSQFAKIQSGESECRRI